jgi:hypothetical protein
MMPRGRNYETGALSVLKLRRPVRLAKLEVDTEMLHPFGMGQTPFVKD